MVTARTTKRCIRCGKWLLSSCANFHPRRILSAGPPPDYQVQDPDLLMDECKDCYQPPAVRPTKCGTPTREEGKKR